MQQYSTAYGYFQFHKHVQHLYTRNYINSCTDSNECLNSSQTEFNISKVNL